MSATSEARPGILKQDSRDAMSPSALLGVNISPRATPKTVSIAPHTEVVSPLVLGSYKSVDGFQLEDLNTWRLPVKGPSSRRLSGRPSPHLKGMSKTSSTDGASDRFSISDGSKHLDLVIDEVATWLRHQREKRSKHKRSSKTNRKENDVQRHAAGKDDTGRRLSEDSNASLDLDKLEDIIKHSLKLDHGSRRSSLKHRPSLGKHRHSTASQSSDTEYYDGEPLVPSCDVVLDNTRTFASTVGDYEDSDGSELEMGGLKRTKSFKDLDAWATFKHEIVRLTHTLRLKGWRSVPMEQSNDIVVERLSGALTNCVYVVTPPEYASDQQKQTQTTEPRKRTAQKLLLRIYGPQVEHLIDRESELQILQRLARKRIGPRMLGTFANGRFEEFFNARPLTPDDMRNSDTSRQIAKRMRELHDGIELIESERNNEPFVWQNWDKWLSRVDQIGTWLDKQVKNLPAGFKPTGRDTWKRRGYICGVQWPLFRSTVERYRKWLVQEYGSLEKVKDNLVFAHNDTQYGNILRLVPAGQSPLLLPANTHKQLIVIDFEYANANLPGLEFANHFTEWCYNYHDKRKPYACNTKLYPTPEEQDRFVRAYVRHRPQYNVSTPKLTPQNSSVNVTPSRPSEMHSRSSSSLTTFMLDARVPASAKDKPVQYDESAELAAENTEVARLLHETRLWRLANSAQWVAWGLVQAEVPDMPIFGADIQVAADEMNADAERIALKEVGEDAEAVAQLSEEGIVEGKEEAEEEFDYLGYAQHRAMFFWGDALQLGFVKAEDLPEDMLSKLKTVKY